MDSITTLRLGHFTGTVLPMQSISSLGLSSGGYVDAMILNGNRCGGPGGNQSASITLDGDDYWCTFQGRSGDGIDRLDFTSAKGRRVSGGGGGGNPFGPIQNARVLRVGGQYGQYLNQIYIEYVENYTPSKLIEASAKAILDFRTGPMDVTSYTEATSQITDTYDRVTQHIESLDINASAQGEYYAKFSVSTGLKTQTTETTEIKTVTEETLRNSQTVADHVNADQVAVLICTVNIMQDANSTYWFYPVDMAAWPKFTRDEFPRLAGHYCVVGGIEEQTGLNSQIKNGFTFLTT